MKSGYRFRIPCGPAVRHLENDLPVARRDPSENRGSAAPLLLAGMSEHSPTVLVVSVMSLVVAWAFLRQGPAATTRATPLD